MNKTDYVLFLCNEYMNDLNKSRSDRDYDDASHFYAPHFYSALIYRNLSFVDVNAKDTNNNSIKEYMIEIYNKQNRGSEYYLEENNHTMDQAYGGNDHINGYLASLYYLQEIRKILGF